MAIKYRLQFVDGKRLWDAGILKLEPPIKAETRLDIHFVTYYRDIPRRIAAVVLSEAQFHDMFADDAETIYVRVSGAPVVNSILSMSRVNTTTSIAIVLNEMNPTPIEAMR